jgi:O-antigen ligase
MLQVRRVSAAALLLLPAGLALYFAFNSGGFYPGAPAYVAMFLCVVLALRVMLAATPFAGFSWPLALAAVAFLAFAVLTLASGLWSHAPGVARVEFDLPLVYLLTMLLFGSIGRTGARLRWLVRGLAAATVITCICGLITRLLPHLWPISPEIANDRLSFPVTYWNVLGLVAAIGVVLCVHLSSDLREPRWARVLAAAAVPPLATTLYFTFSRGSIAACIIALVAYLLIGRPLGLISSLLVIGPSTGIALKLAYDANLLASPNPTTAAAVVQGRHVAIAVGICAVAGAVVRMLLAQSLDTRLVRLTLPDYLRPSRGWHAWVPVAAAAVIAVVAFRGTLAHDYHRFVHPVTTTGSDLRARLTDPTNNGRLGYWHVASRQFKLAPVAGQGAGTYASAWAEYRASSNFARDAHSLYMETLDELGVVGLVLLLITILTILVRAAARARGPRRPLYAAVFAALLAWAIHAGVDWDWEMPVVTIMFFALGGLTLSRSLERTRRRDRPETVSASRKGAGLRGRPRLLARALIAAPLLAAAVLPGFTWLSQTKLDNAAYAFSQGDYAAARRAALSSISILGNRAEPYEILSYCDLRLGRSAAALREVNKAVSLDPNNWSYRYSVALMRAAAGIDPRPAARKALSLNPREPLVQDEWNTFRAGNPAQWRSLAKTIAGNFATL